MAAMKTLRPLAVLLASALLASGRPPNILLIVTDDLGFGDPGCYGAEQIATPRIDRLADEGLRFTSAYAPASTCTPTRYSILTGEYPWRQKVRKNTILDGDAPLAFETSQPTVAGFLKSAGYTTGVVGKWHLGLGDGVRPVDFNAEIKPGPLEIGFDYCHIIPATVDRVPSLWIENHRVVGLDPEDPIEVSYQKRLGDEPTGIERPDLLKQKADEQHSGIIINGISRIGSMTGGHAARFKDEELPATVVEKSVAFLEKHKDAPFFLMVGMFEPHVPRVAAPTFAGKSKCGVRGDVIQQIDWQTGELLDALERLGIADDTVVFLTSDNGPLFFDGYFDGSERDANGHKPAGGLRGGKYNVFEGGTRVPFIARGPGVRKGTTDAILCLTDIFATAAGLAEQPKPEAGARDSIDQTPVLRGEPAEPVRGSVITQGISGAVAIRDGDWKFIPANGKAGAAGMGSGANASDKRFAAAVITEDLLFDLGSDRGETKNVISEQPGRAAALRKALVEEGAPVTKR